MLNIKCIPLYFNFYLNVAKIKFEHLNVNYLRCHTGIILVSHDYCLKIPFFGQLQAAVFVNHCNFVQHSGHSNLNSHYQQN